MAIQKTSYRPVDILTVYFFPSGEKIKIGKMAIKNRQIWFEYDQEFIKTGIELSPIRLPLRGGLFSGKDSPFDGLFGLFNDSLPDGWGKLLLDRAMTAKGIDFHNLSPLDRLSLVGNTGMGALIYEPDYNDYSSNEEFLDLNAISGEVENVLKGTAEETLNELYYLGGSSAGARPKIVVGFNSVENKIIHGQKELPDGYESWLIKFTNSADHKSAGQIEYAYSLMAKASGIEIPETRLFNGLDGKKWFGIKRFDRDRNQRIHMHSVAGLLHADFRTPSIDYDSILRCSMVLNPDVNEATKLFRLAVFNVYAHNRDDHSKNFSFLMDKKGNWRFAPAYDLTYSNGPGGEHSTLVNGEGRNPQKSHLLQLADRFNINNPQTIIEEVIISISNWTNFAKDAEVDKASTQKIEKILRRKLKD